MATSNDVTCTQTQLYRYTRHPEKVRGVGTRKKETNSPQFNPSIQEAEAADLYELQANPCYTARPQLKTQPNSFVLIQTIKAEIRQAHKP